MRTDIKRLAVAILQIGMACLVSATGKVTDVSVTDIAGGPAVHIGGTDLPRPTVKWKDGAVVLQFHAYLSSTKGILRANEGCGAKVSISQAGAVVSIAVWQLDFTKPQIAKDVNGWLVSFPAHGKAPADSSSRASTVNASNKASEPLDDALCSLQVTEMDPAQILQVLSTQTHANLVLLTKPDTKLTIRLAHVPLSEMIRHICAMCDLIYLRVGKTYVIATEERMKKAYPTEWDALHPPVPVQVPVVVERTSEAYTAGFSTGAEMAKTLEKVFTGKDVTFVAGPASVSPQVGYQDSAKATGTSTSVLAKDESAGGESRVVVISGPKDVVAAALAMAKRLDRPRGQVSIAVTIHDISNDDLKDLGITWDFGTETFQESTPNGVNFGTFSRTPLSISTALTALDQRQRSKLLAAPHVSVLDGERAFVLIGSRISYPVLVGYSQNNAPIFSKEEERVGIYLQVSASIGLDGTITLSLYPQVSTITGYLNINGASYPQISTREAQSTLMMQSGETIVMGGLFSDEEIAILDKVPFLSQIPILGEIFKHRKVTKTKSQVIITVTPTVIGRKTQ